MDTDRNGESAKPVFSPRAHRFVPEARKKLAGGEALRNHRKDRTEERCASVGQETRHSPLSLPPKPPRAVRFPFSACKSKVTNAQPARDLTKLCRICDKVLRTNWRGFSPRPRSPSAVPGKRAGPTFPLRLLRTLVPCCCVPALRFCQRTVPQASRLGVRGASCSESKRAARRRPNSQADACGTATSARPLAVPTAGAMAPCCAFSWGAGSP